METLQTFFTEYGGQLLFKTWEHLYISLISISLGILVAVPLGVALTRVPKVADKIMSLVGIIQTFPTLAILAFFIPLLGIGKVPAIVALFFYSLLPILRNTYTGVYNLNENILEAGRGMGMTGWERIRMVELPLAIPVIMAGIRVSTVYLIGWATLAAYIGAGGLGDFIFDGLNLFKTEFILAGAIPTTLLALIIDYVFGRLEERLTPTGIRNTSEAA
ncbi:glycine betaine/carnitine/choline transport system permease protein OpuCB [Virgibacillus pantothenticus]|uniref:Choline ABC transporter permease n=1 Tax=Virgibacillus pantothenticus TaxID=1473 RepID=A0A0L0QRV3_VIRPA|nr:MULTISPECIES: ABC transporter permease [Virgibacillus]API92106.1 choline ABC transporter permease [Virgibacillus sp. 6R]KNE21281.1 choline ABC transporter permease [Virgibacillus pantothenticus]MBS7430575.1 ABC transporter permease [Virgibacillus sp. 19R1-5]MBU8568343.1 ABC transporter permease [Virgibacillus pantothenticus]MBU8602384.1 ABC transporter permease [Virgibacillus pantothenticus]